MAKTALARLLHRICLDARPDQLDLRDREFQPGYNTYPLTFPHSRIGKNLPRYLQQKYGAGSGQNGACTSFALAALIQYSRARLSGEFELVQPAYAVSSGTFLHDEFPGENYQGSSCRGVLKALATDMVWRRREYWPYTVSSPGPGG